MPPLLFTLSLTLLGLLLAGPGLRAAYVLLPVDLLRDLGAWKADPTEHHGVSNALLSDPLVQFEAWDTFARRSLRERQIPWINPHQGEAEPFLANPQTGLLSPLTWLRLAFPRAGWALGALAKTLTGGMGVFFLARIVGAGVWAASVSGLVYAASGWSVVWILYPLTGVSAFLPWLASGAILVARERRPAYALLTVVAAALATAAGHPETLFFGVVGIALWLVWERLTFRGRGLVPAAAAALLGFLLLAPLTVPFLALLPGSRALATGEARSGFRWAALVSQVIPGFLGSPLGSELDLSLAVPGAENLNERASSYLGAIVLLLLALAARRLDGPFRRGLVVGAAFLLLALRVPGLGGVVGLSRGAPERAAIPFVLFASLAAGPALEAVARGPRRRGTGLAVAAAGLSLAVAGCVPVIPAARDLLARVSRRGVETLRARGKLHQPSAVYEARLADYVARGRGTALRRIALPGIAWAVAGLALLGRGSLRERRALLAGALAAELVGFGLGYNPAVRADSRPEEPEAIRDLRRADPAAQWRLASTDGAFPPDLATHYGLHDLASYDAGLGRDAFVRRLVALGYDESVHSFRSPLDGSAVRGLAAEGVRFVLSRVPPEGVARVGGGAPPAVGLYELPGAVRLRFARQAPPVGFGAGVALALVALLGTVGLVVTLRRAEA